MRPPYECDISQRCEEFEEFIELLVQEKVRSYLEIGSYCGGTLWWVANWGVVLGDRLVTVDNPVNDRAHLSLAACHNELIRIGYSTMQIVGNSQDAKVIAAAKAYGPYDAVFIDGDHTLKGVEADWRNYGPMAKKLVAFHDVCWEGHKPEKMQAREHWERLRNLPGVKTKTISRQERAYGIGVLWK